MAQSDRAGPAKKAEDRISEQAKTILVTGADGFVGRHLCAALGAAGHRVRRVVRRTPDRPDDWCVNDLATDDIPDAACAGVDVLIHLAANMKGHSGDPTGTETAQMAGRVAASAARHRVERSVLLSSVAVRLMAHDESTARAYSIEKREAENAFSAALGDANRRIILRPPVIYGDGAQGSFGLLLKLIRRGIPLPVRDGTSPRCYLSVSNLCALMEALVGATDAQWDAANGAAFEPHDGPAVSTRELALMMAGTLGRTPRLFSVPRPFLDLAARATGKTDQVNAIFEPLICAEPDALQNAFGWQPHEHMPHSLRFLRD